MNERNGTKAISEAVRQLPDWLRAELTSKDVSTRTRAEEALTARIAAALAALQGDNTI